MGSRKGALLLGPEGGKGRVRQNCGARARGTTKEMSQQGVNMDRFGKHFIQMKLRKYMKENRKIKLENPWPGSSVG